MPSCIIAAICRSLELFSVQVPRFPVHGMASESPTDGASRVGSSPTWTGVQSWRWAGLGEARQSVRIMDLSSVGHALRVQTLAVCSTVVDFKSEQSAPANVPSLSHTRERRRHSEDDTTPQARRGGCACIDNLKLGASLAHGVAVAIDKSSASRRQSCCPLLQRRRYESRRCLLFMHNPRNLTSVHFGPSVAARMVLVVQPVHDRPAEWVSLH